MKEFKEDRHCEECGDYLESLEWMSVMDEDDEYKNLCYECNPNNHCYFCNKLKGDDDVFNNLNMCEECEEKKDF